MLRVISIFDSCQHHCRKVFPEQKNNEANGKRPLIHFPNVFVSKVAIKAA